MTHIVNDKCFKCKYTDCVEVCPVDCFHEGDDILVIDPDVCIDCGICIVECPVDAIVNNDTYVESKTIEEILASNDSDLSDEQRKIRRLYEFNNVYSKMWPKITKIKEKHVEEEIFSKIDDKMKYIDDSFK